MATNPLNDITGYTAAHPTNTTSKSNSALGKDDFMKLLMSQMKYQDPLNPSDSTQFAAQLAQYSSLEQLQNMNANMTQSISANYSLSQSINNTMAATLIGKEVKLSGGDFTYNGQENITLGYNIGSNAKDVTIKIYNEKGGLVQTIKKSDMDKGGHTEVWDFVNNIGSKVTAGQYKFEVTATAINGDTLTPEIYKYGTISGVKYTDAGTKLLVGGVEYQLSDITEIFDTGKTGG